MSIASQKNAEGILEYETVYVASFNKIMNLDGNKQKFLKPLGERLRGNFVREEQPGNT